MRHSMRLAFAGVALSLSMAAASAQTAVKVGCILATDCAAISVGKTEGIFQKHGLDVTVEFVAFNGLVPAALMSHSLDIGGLTASVFVQAVDGGLDLAAISGGTVFTGTESDGYALVVKSGSTLRGASDFVGKKVATPSINGVLTILFVNWLKTSGVDPGQVSLVEVPYPSIGDALGTGTVDAGLISEPMLSVIRNAGTGEAAASLVRGIPDGTPAMFYTATREWAAANPKTVASFREALAEASKIVAEDPNRARAAHASLTGTPAKVLQNVNLATPSLELKSEGLDWWVSTMAAQNLLQTDPATANLIIP